MAMSNKAAVVKFSSYQKQVIALLTMTQFTVVLDFMVMSPLGDMLMKSMNLTTAQFGFAVSAYAFSAGISGFLTAGFADRFDRKKLLLFFYVGFIAGTLCCGLATTYSMLITARIITGVFGGVMGSISMAIVADLFPLEQRGRVMGFMQMGFGASQVLGIPISLFLANAWSWQAPFLMIVALSAAVWIVAMIKLEPITKHLLVQTDKSPLLHLWHTIANRHYRIGFLATAFLSLGGFMMMPWGSAFAVNNLGVSYAQLPILFMVAGVSTLIIMPVIGKLSDRMDKFTLFAAASVWMMIFVLIYTHLSHVPFWVVISCQAAMGLGTLLGGWRIVHTMGSRITHLKPIQGFCAETGGALTLFLATALGVPVSTTHTITGAIVGVGAARRAAAVRWPVAQRIVVAWVMTLPAAGLIGALVFTLVSYF
jgi:predicted MFS family arabinose efflux permease